MTRIDKISARQFAIQVCFFTVGTSILIAPSVLAHQAKQDAWIGAMLGIAANLLLAWLYVALARRFPKQTLMQYSERLLGKWGGRLVSLFFLLFFFYLSALLVADMGFFLRSQILTETPLEWIQVMFMLVVVYAVRLGIEPLFRSGEILFRIVLALFLIIVVSIAPQIDVHNLLPVMEGGLPPLLRSSFTFLALQELPLFLILFPYVNRADQAGKALLIGTAIGGGILILTSLLSILVIGPAQTEQSVYPAYILAQKIDIAHFFHRIEAVLAVIWFITIFYKLTVCFYATLIGFAQTFRLRGYRFLTFPLAFLIIVIGQLSYPNMTYAIRFVAFTWAPFALTVMLVIPLVLLIASVLRRLGSASPTEDGADPA